MRQRRKLTVTSILGPYWKSLAAAFVAVLFMSGTDLLQPYPLKIVFDNVLGSKPMPDFLARLTAATVGDSKQGILLFAALLVIAVALAGAIGSYTQKYLTTNIGQRVMHDLRSMLYNHIQNLSLSFYEQKKTGDLVVRMTGDIDDIQSFVSSALLSVVVDVLTLVGMVGVMLYLNWKFTLISLSVAPALFFVVYSFTHRIKKAARAVKKKEGEIASVVQEAITSVHVVKAFASEDYEVQRLEKESLESVEMALRARTIKAKLAPLVDLIVAVGTCLVLWYGTGLVLAGELSAGALLVFIVYLGKLYAPMRDLSKMTDTLSKASVAFERVQEVLETESEVKEPPNAIKAPPFRGKIEFENVRFGYNDDRTVFEDLNLKIEPGQFVALVGPTGSGKSSLIRLIPRFYDPESGRVKIDDRDIRDFTLKSLRDQISIVLQETLLFNADVWHNIAYGKPGAKRKDVIAAAKEANAHEFIEKMPRGYDTVIGERGQTLSGGQRQRIAIARAFLRDAPILLLDEPSSGLDALSEELVFQAVDRLAKDKTTIVIAHRLTTVLRADMIYVVSGGRIKESGTHQQLLDSGGLYSQYYEVQFKPQEEPGLLVAK